MMVTSTLSSWASAGRVASADKPSHQSGAEPPTLTGACSRVVAHGWPLTGGRSQVVLGLGQNGAQALLDVVELGLADDQRWRELDHRVATVVGSAVQTRIEQRLGQEPAQQSLALVIVERLAGRLVLDQLDPVEVALAADIADQWQVEQLVQGGPETRGVVLDVLVEAF